MAGRKLTINDAISFLRDQGLSVSIEKVEEEPIPEKRVSPNRGRKKGTQRVTLRGEHRISSDSQTLVFGPGVVDVPVEYVNHVVSQDQRAVLADERMRSKEFKTYLVVPRATMGGEQGVSKLAVDSDVLGGSGFGHEVARNGNAHIVRGK